LEAGGEGLSREGRGWDSHFSCRIFFQVLVAVGVLFNNSNEFLLHFDVFRFTFRNGYKSIHQREAARERADL